MNTERDPFELGKLPQLEMPSDGWPAIEAAMKITNRRRRSVAGGLAVAALVLVAVGVVTQLPGPAQPSPAKVTQSPQLAAQRTGIEQGGSDVASLTSPFESTPGSNNSKNGSSNGSTNLQNLVALSQKLERNLRVMRQQVGSMPASAVVYQVELEDLVAQVDEALSMQPDRADLWSQRVNLLLDLGQIYGMELRREYGTLASL